SCNDPVGHTFGPDAPEVLDVTLRSDRIMKALLDHLDASVGRGRYLVALSADHGVCPLPEVSRARGRETGRVPLDLLGKDGDAFLREKSGDKNGQSHWIEGSSEPWVYLNRRLITERRLDPAAVERALADWYCRQPGVQAGYTRSQLLREPPDKNPVAKSV